MSLSPDRAKDLRDHLMKIAEAVHKSSEGTLAKKAEIQELLDAGVELIELRNHK